MDLKMFTAEVNLKEAHQTLQKAMRVAEANVMQRKEIVDKIKSEREELIKKQKTKK